MKEHPGKVWICLVVGAGLAGSLIACSTDKALLIGDEQEREVGVQVDQQIRQEYTVCDPPVCEQQILQYVSALGNQMAAKSDRNDIAYTFTVLHSDEINAFAAPGGFIYITTGLLRESKNASEVAGVLGHEIGHIVERHGAEQMEAQLGAELLRDLIFGTEATTASTVADIVFGSYSAFVQSPEKELEADVHGVLLPTAINYTPNGLIGFFKTLQVLFGDESSPLSEILSTHPQPAERISHAEQTMTELGIKAQDYPEDTTNPPFSTIRSMLPPPAGDIQ
ncbi:MAG: M48 family metalloprotease [Myxococcales bacterium]|nr:M48 family metalloprotease [Myxococcales bacterium]